MSDLTPIIMLIITVLSVFSEGITDTCEEITETCAEITEAYSAKGKFLIIRMLFGTLQNVHF